MTMRQLTAGTPQEPPEAPETSEQEPERARSYAESSQEVVQRPGGVECSDSGREGEMLLRPRRLLGRPLGLTRGIAGLLALKLGIASKALLILSGIAALVPMCLLLLALALFGG
jgi:hypothetical protein